MRLSHRLFGCLVVGVALVSTAFAWTDVRERTAELRAGLTKQTANDANGLEQALVALAKDGDLDRADTAVERARTRAKLTGIVVVDRQGRPITTTKGLSARKPLFNISQTTASSTSVPVPPLQAT